MSKLRWILIIGALWASGVSGKAQEFASLEAPPDHIPHAVPCCPPPRAHEGGLKRIVRWFTYVPAKENKRKCGCCKEPFWTCRPPLYAYFLCVRGPGHHAGCAGACPTPHYGHD